MGTVHSKWKDCYGNLVFYDGTNRMRWIDAVGPGATVFDAAKPPSTALLTITAVSIGAGTSTLVCQDLGWLITNAGNEDDGINAQLTGGGYYCVAAKPWYFGAKVTISEATESDLLLGLCILDTTLLGGMTDGVYFECVDGGTGISTVTEKDSTETQNDTQGTMDTSAHVYEIVWDGTDVKYFIDGTQTAAGAHTTHIPDNEPLTPSIHFLNGSAAARTCTVDWCRAIQVQA